MTAPATTSTDPRSRTDGLGWVTRAALRRADLVLPTSASVTEEMTARYRIPVARTATLSWGVDDDLLRLRDTVHRPGVRDAFGIPAAATVLLSVRSAAPVYRTDDILRAFAQVAEERPDLHLVVLAGHEPAESGAAEARTGCLARAAELAESLPGRVTLVRRTLTGQETFALMCASDIAVSVPRWDQRSSSVLEAALAGCRLLLADLPPYRELLADGLVAELVPEPLGAGLAGLLRTAGSLPERDRSANRSFIETSETWSRQVSAMQGFYRRLSAGARPPAGRPTTPRPGAGERS
ncbi:hypothetical protein NCC78_08605 [Micromonospora phytophila]|uniref:glycosyltransferase n=1 Tax=Micromonospora phytophila TaxID=709888 RepID=UPI00202F5631|nr:glycosyltransferase [Micromonospora phytophila]MCM0674748.1 hypothetical protein [Micromonospora phytophila]